MNKEQMVAVATQIILDGFKNGIDADDIKGAMFSNGIGFSKINSIYNAVCIEQQLIIDPKVINKSIKAEVDGTGWDVCTTWTDVENFIAAIMTAVKVDTGADVKRSKILAAVRTYCLENEIILPKEEKAPRRIRVKGGTVSSAVVNCFVNNPQTTRQELYEVVRPLVKGHKNTVSNINSIYLTCFAIANKITIPEAYDATLKFNLPTLDDGVAFARSRGLEIPDADIKL